MGIHLLLEDRDDWAVARLTGAGTAHEVVQCYPQILQECHRRGVKRLLVDLSRVSASLSTADRFDMGEKTAPFTRAGIAVAVVGTPEQLDPARLGELVATNRGLTLRVFTDERAAEDWLRMRPAAE